MRIVLDTNILLVSISSKSPFHWIFEAINSGTIQLCISNEIINEYAEIIERYFDKNVSELTIDAILNSPVTIFINQYYRWNLINQDPDDNKFVDCAIASNAECIITNDNHFNILKNLNFPSVKIMTYSEFYIIFKK